MRKCVEYERAWKFQVQFLKEKGLSYEEIRRNMPWISTEELEENYKE